MAGAAADARAAARTAADIGAVSDRRALHGVAKDHAAAMLAAASTTLDRLSDLGWRAVVGDPPRAAGRPGRAGRPGPSAVTPWRNGPSRSTPWRPSTRTETPVVSGRQPPDTAGMTWTVAPSPTGVVEVRRLTVDEHVDVRPEARPLLDEAVAHARGRRVERMDDPFDRVARHLVPALDAREQGEQRAREQDRGHGLSRRGRPPRPPRSPAGWPSPAATSRPRRRCATAARSSSRT